MALLRYYLFQIRDKPRDLAEISASSFAAARELEAGSPISSCICGSVVSFSFR